MLSPLMTSTAYGNKKKMPTLCGILKGWYAELVNSVIFMDLLRQMAVHHLGTMFKACLCPPNGFVLVWQCPQNHFQSTRPKRSLLLGHRKDLLARLRSVTLGRLAKMMGRNCVLHWQQIWWWLWVHEVKHWLVSPPCWYWLVGERKVTLARWSLAVEQFSTENGLTEGGGEKSCKLVVFF